MVNRNGFENRDWKRSRGFESHTFRHMIWNTRYYWVKKYISYLAFPAIVFLVHLVGYEVFDVYTVHPVFDIPMHFFGGMSIAYLWHGVYGIMKNKWNIDQIAIPTHGMFVFLLSFVSTVLWECYEFVSDTYGGTRLQEGMPDTLLDIFIGILGVVFFFTILQLRFKTPKLRQ